MPSLCPALVQQRAVLGCPSVCGHSCPCVPRAEPVPKHPRGCARHKAQWLCRCFTDGGGRGPSIVLLGEQCPSSCPQVIQSAGRELGHEHSCTDKVLGALNGLPQDIPATPGDAATAGKELQAGLEGGTAAQASLGKESGELSRPRESAFSTQLCSSIRGAQPKGIFAQMHSKGENIKPPPEPQHRAAASSGESSDHHSAAASLKPTCMRAEIQHPGKH